jgi:hypothetical protein
MIGSLAFDGAAGNASFMLHHFWLLYAGVILFSAAELIVDAMLTAGALTRVAALMFGWLGATCIDEWTMAACNLAMGATRPLRNRTVGYLLLRANRELPHLHRRPTAFRGLPL